MSDDLKWLAIIAVMLLGSTTLITGGTIAVRNYMAFPQERARIEQLRSDSQHLDPRIAEDVIGQITQVNQEIVAQQTYSRYPVIGVLVPSGWNDIDTIAIPEQQ